FYTVHHPETVAGSVFYAVAPGLDRAKVRKERPPASLYILSVTSRFADTLKSQCGAREKEQEQIDAGIDPRRISSAIPLPALREQDIVVDFDEFKFSLTFTPHVLHLLE